MADEFTPEELAEVMATEQPVRRVGDALRLLLTPGAVRVVRVSAPVYVEEAARQIPYGPAAGGVATVVVVSGRSSGTFSTTRRSALRTLRDIEPEQPMRGYYNSRTRVLTLNH